MSKRKQNKQQKKIHTIFLKIKLLCPLSQSITPLPPCPNPPFFMLLKIPPLRRQAPFIFPKKRIIFFAEFKF